jgi:protein SCO1/2
MSRNLQVMLVAAVAAAGLAAGYLVGRSPGPAPGPALESATLFETPRPVPAFALTDQDGRPFGREQLAGRWTILFFGFTHCPDVCPSTLATLAAARRELADLPAGVQPRVVLVSVDPKRDTVERLKPYVAFFDPSFAGVTGPAEAISTFTAQLGVAVRQGPRDASGNYTVDHTAALFLVDPDGTLVGIFSTPHTPDGITHDYRRILEARGAAS